MTINATPTTSTPSSVPYAASGQSFISYLAETPPDVRQVTINGTRCVAVSLTGLYGDGKEMLLDDDVWADISTTITPFWSVARMGGFEYIYSGCSIAAAIARQSSKASMLFLARHIAKPPAGHNVAYRDGDHFNLTRANLVAVTRRQQSQANVRLRMERQRLRDGARHGLKA